MGSSDHWGEWGTGSQQAGSAPGEVSEWSRKSLCPPGLRSRTAGLLLVLEQGRSQEAGHAYACGSCICMQTMIKYVKVVAAAGTGWSLDSGGLGSRSRGHQVIHL